jgi:hypothetical protein
LINSWKIVGFGDEYFGTLDAGESNKSFMQGYKSVLNAKQVEDNLVRKKKPKLCYCKL